MQSFNFDYSHFRIAGQSTPGGIVYISEPALSATTRVGPRSLKGTCADVKAT